MNTENQNRSQEMPQTGEPAAADMPCIALLAPDTRVETTVLPAQFGNGPATDCWVVRDDGGDTVLIGYGHNDRAAVPRSSIRLPLAAATDSRGMCDADAPTVVPAAPCAPPVWATPPDCPKCGKPLSEAPTVWKPRGEWMCHEDHDGKRIWFNYELTMILRARLRVAHATAEAWGRWRPE